MPLSAHVTSLETLREFREGLIAFCEAAAAALCAVDMDVRRTVEYLTQEKMSYWRNQAQSRYEEVNAARNDLSRRHLGQRDHRLDDTEQKKALRLAQARLAESEEKVEKIRKWMPVIQRSIDDYRGQLRRLESLLEGEPPTCVQKFDQILAPLEEYLRLSPPPGLEPASESAAHGAWTAADGEPEASAGQADSPAPPGAVAAPAENGNRDNIPRTDTDKALNPLGTES